MGDVRSKACASYRSGRLRILSALTLPGADRPCHVEAYVFSTRPGPGGTQLAHRVRLDSGEWSCTCHRGGCAHVEAIKLAVGHDSAAARPQRGEDGG